MQVWCPRGQSDSLRGAVRHAAGIDLPKHTFSLVCELGAQCDSHRLAPQRRLAAASSSDVTPVSVERCPSCPLPGATRWLGGRSATSPGTWDAAQASAQVGGVSLPSPPPPPAPEMPSPRGPNDSPVSFWHRHPPERQEKLVPLTPVSMTTRRYMFN